MPYIIAGLGNPGEEYKITRHNTGRLMVETLAKKYSFPDFKRDQKIKALVSKGEIAGEKITLIAPDNYMNNSGKSIGPLFPVSAKAATDKSKSAKPKALKLIVIYDDLDLPLGKIKISFNKSSGGHRGLDSIIKAVKTESFPRIRVGISPLTPSGKIKKPHGGEAVEKHIIGEFKKPELDELKKISKTVIEAVESLVTENVEIAMGKFN